MPNGAEFGGGISFSQNAYLVLGGESPALWFGKDFRIHSGQGA